MVINRKLGREEMHANFGEDNGRQHSLKERKDRELEFHFKCS